MKLNDCTIKPAEGFGPIKFGMTQDQIKKILGEPNRISKEFDDTEISYHYYDSLPTLIEPPTLIVTFNGDYDFKLTNIFVSGGNKYSGIKHKDITLFSTRIHELAVDQIMELLHANNITDAVIEETESPTDTYKINSDQLSMTIYFNKDKKFTNFFLNLTWVNDDTPNWPKL